MTFYSPSVIRHQFFVDHFCLSLQFLHHKFVSHSLLLFHCISYFSIYFLLYQFISLCTSGKCILRYILSTDNGFANSVLCLLEISDWYTLVFFALVLAILNLSNHVHHICLLHYWILSLFSIPSLRLLYHLDFVLNLKWAIKSVLVIIESFSIYFLFSHTMTITSACIYQHTLLLLGMFY